MSFEHVAIVDNGFQTSSSTTAQSQCRDGCNQVYVIQLDSTLPWSVPTKVNISWIPMPCAYRNTLQPWHRISFFDNSDSFSPEIDGGNGTASANKMCDVMHPLLTACVRFAQHDQASSFSACSLKACSTTSTCPILGRSIRFVFTILLYSELYSFHCAFNTCICRCAQVLLHCNLHGTLSTIGFLPPGNLFPREYHPVTASALSS